MSKFKVGNVVVIKKTKQVGIVRKVNRKGRVTQVSVDGEIIDTTDMIIKFFTLLQFFWLGLKSIFKKQ